MSVITEADSGIDKNVYTGGNFDNLIQEGKSERPLRDRIIGNERSLLHT